MSEDSDYPTFRGQGPFHLPTVQSATAVGDKDNGVTMMLKAVLPGRGPAPESVHTQMISSVARKLAHDLLKAADEAEAD